MIPFNDIKVSTQTFTVKTNVCFTATLEQIFELITPTQYLITIRYKQTTKGVVPPVKKKNKNPSSKKNFLNCISMVILLDKKINVKIFKNGVFQLTGCKTLNHAKESVHIIFKYINTEIFTDLFETPADEDIICYFKSAMRNIDFSLGYKINREELAQQLHLNTTLNIPPITCTNMGVKIKLPINLGTLPVYKMILSEYPVHTTVKYSECFDYLMGKPTTEEERSYKMNKFISIAIFQNGKITFSCADKIFQEQYYNWFNDIMENIKPFIINSTAQKKSFYD
jgi:hypothetical protein